MSDSDATIEIGEGQPTSKSPAAWAAWARDASERGAWQAALERWSVCIEKFGPRPEWKAREGTAFLELGRLDDAERVFAALAEGSPEKPMGLVGLAGLAMRRQDWQGAISYLAQCREAHPDKGTAMLANALFRSGRAAEAEVLWSRLAEEHPDVQRHQVMRIRSGIEACRQAGDFRERRAELRRQIGDIFLSDDDDLRSHSILLLDLIGDRAEAARQLLWCIERVQSIQQIERCFRAIPIHIERGSRGPLWDRLLARVREQMNEAGVSASPVTIELELRLLLTLERFAEFSARFDAVRPCLSGMPSFLFLERVCERLGKPRSEVFAERKVFGIGLAKTGTTSLNEALLALGIDAAHWANPLTHQLLSDIDIFLFGASTDTAVSQDFEKLYYQYPNALFVLTRRPLEAWKKSFEGHHAHWNRAASLDDLRMVYDREHSRFAFSAAAIQFGLYFNAANLADAHRTFERRVRHFFSDKPSGKLLEIDIFAGEGWTELCGFLNRPVPARPFPWTNRGRQDENGRGA